MVRNGQEVEGGAQSTAPTPISRVLCSPARSLSCSQAWLLDQPRKNSCEHPRRHIHRLSLIPNPSVHLDRIRFVSIAGHTADFGHHTEITLEDVPNGDYALRLYGHLGWKPVLQVPPVCQGYNLNSATTHARRSATGKIALNELISA